MADIAISQLTYGLPSSTASIPFSQSGTTLRVAPSGLLVNAGKVGINTSNPRSELTFSRANQLSAYSIEFNVQGGISNGHFDGIKFTQGSNGEVDLAAIKCRYFNTGQTALEFSTRMQEVGSPNLSADPMLILDRNNGNVLNHGLILSGGPLTMDYDITLRDHGITTLNVARGWTYGGAPAPGTTYVHLLLPADFNQSQSNMFLLEIKGYNFTNAWIINMMIGGYVTPASNGGPMRNVSAWQAVGSFSPTAYYSNTYNRGVARFYLSNAYYTSFVVNSICVGNGRVIKPGEIQIIYSTNATL